MLLEKDIPLLVEAYNKIYEENGEITNLEADKAEAYKHVEAALKRIRLISELDKIQTNVAPIIWSLENIKEQIEEIK